MDADFCIQTEGLARTYERPALRKAFAALLAGTVKTARSWRAIVAFTHLAREGRMTVTIGRRELLVALGGAAAGWPLAAVAESMTQPIQATTANPPQIEVVRVKPIDPAAPKLRFQLSDGSVDLMKSFRLDGFDGVGGAWKIPSTDETFDARYGRW